MPAKTVPALDKVDPVEAWQPWQPGPKDPWNLKWASHLRRRAGFGTGWSELRSAVKQGAGATLDQLIQGHAEPDAREGFESLLRVTGPQVARQNNPFQLRGWWVYCLLNSPHPLREKMTLFWHNHFATSIAKVQRATLMCNQNLLIRKHALAKFEPFLQDMSKDAAMLVWLDSNSNVKGKPNENYARELMELFSLGVGHYTEHDIREAARAFTGWQTAGDKYEFNGDDHDAGEKTVLGKKGDWNGEDIVRIVLEQPAAASFLVRKLYHYFISENAEPPELLLEPLADFFRKSDYDIGTLVDRMLRSRHFFSDHAYRQRIKSPVEFVMGGVLAFRSETTKNGGDNNVRPDALVAKFESMGQQLFAPPNVKGWPGGKSWLNTATVLARHNFVQSVAGGRLDSAGGRYAGYPPELAEQLEEQERQAQEAAELQAEAQRKQPGAEKKKVAEPPPHPALDAAGLVRQEKAADAPAIVTLLVKLLLDGQVSKGSRNKLVNFVADGQPEGPDLDRRIRETVHAIMTMPEYQLA